MKKTDIRVHSEIPAYQNRTLLPNELPGQIGFEFQAFLFLKAYAEFDLCMQLRKDRQLASLFPMPYPVLPTRFFVEPFGPA